MRSKLATPTRLWGVVPERDASERRHDAIALNAALHDIRGEALCMTAEAFSFLRTPGERELYDILLDGFEVRPILFVREHESWMASWRAQTARLLNRARPDNLHGTVFDYAPDSWLLDDESIIRFHGLSTKVLSYEECLECEGGSIPAFLRTLGLDPATMPDASAYWWNRTAVHADENRV